MKRKINLILVLLLISVGSSGCSERSPIEGVWSGLEEPSSIDEVSLSRFANFSFDTGNKLYILTEQTAISYAGNKEVGAGKGAQMYGAYRVKGQDIICTIRSASVEYRNPDGVPTQIDRRLRLNLIIDYGWKLKPGRTLELTEKSVHGDPADLVFPVGSSIDLSQAS